MPIHEQEQAQFSQKIEQFYNLLPQEFSTFEALALGQDKFGNGERTIRYWIEKLINEDWLFQLYRGRYTKQDPALTPIAGVTHIESVYAQPDQAVTDNLINFGKTSEEVDLDKGTSKIIGLASEEPRSAEEVETLLKIDKTKWKLSTYWNKQQGNGTWLVSALITQRKKEEKDYITELLANFNPQVTAVPKPHINHKYADGVAGVIATQDLHFGKEGNEGIFELFKKALVDLVLKSYSHHNIDKIYFVLGGDLINMDTFLGTTTKGTIVQSHLNPMAAYTQAFEALHWAIGYLKQFCNNLVVVYVPGNHDRLSSFHLAHAISKVFANQGIEFDIKYAERKVHVYGTNFFGFQHGDVTKKTDPLTFASEFPDQWGATRHRIAFTGHKHIEQTKEYITKDEIVGFSLKILPSLSATDYYHYHEKWTGGKRAAIMELFHPVRGSVTQFNHVVEIDVNLQDLTYLN